MGLLRRRPRPLPVSWDIDRINEIANGLAAASLSLQIEDQESAKKAVGETLAQASAYLSRAVTEARARERRRRAGALSGGGLAAATALAALALAPGAPTSDVEPAGTPVTASLPDRGGSDLAGVAETPAADAVHLARARDRTPGPTGPTAPADAETTTGPETSPSLAIGTGTAQPTGTISEQPAPGGGAVEPAPGPADPAPPAEGTGESPDHLGSAPQPPAVDPEQATPGPGRSGEARGLQASNGDGNAAQRGGPHEEPPARDGRSDRGDATA